MSRPETKTISCQRCGFVGHSEQNHHCPLASTASPRPEPDVEVRTGWEGYILVGVGSYTKSESAPVVFYSKDAFDKYAASRDEEVKSLHDIRLGEMRMLCTAQEENKRLRAEIEKLNTSCIGWEMSFKDLQRWREAADIKAARLSEALNTFQEGINPEDMTAKQREAMGRVSLKVRGGE